MGFYSKNKFEKLVQLVGFIIRIYHDTRSAERQITQQLPTGWTIKGSNPGVGRDFLQPSRRALGPNQPPLKWITGPLTDGVGGAVVERLRSGGDDPLPSSDEVKPLNTELNPICQ